MQGLEDALTRLPSSEQLVAEQLISSQAKPLDTYTRKGVLRGANKVINLSCSQEPKPLIYVTEERIKDKFSNPPSFIRFSHPLSISLLDSSDAYFEPGKPLTYIRLCGGMDLYSLEDQELAVADTRFYEQATGYSVSLNNLFSSSPALENVFSCLRSERSETASVGTTPLESRGLRGQALYEQTLS